MIHIYSKNHKATVVTKICQLLNNLEETVLRYCVSPIFRSFVLQLVLAMNDRPNWISVQWVLCEANPAANMFFWQWDTYTESFSVSQRHHEFVCRSIVNYNHLSTVMGQCVRSFIKINDLSLFWINHVSSEQSVTVISYRKTSIISRTKSHDLNVSCILLQLSSLNSLKPGVKLRMKM